MTTKPPKPMRVTKKTLLGLIDSIETEQWGGGDPYLYDSGRAMDKALRRVLQKLVQRAHVQELRGICDEEGLAKAINNLHEVEVIAEATYEERQNER